MGILSNHSQTEYMNEYADVWSSLAIAVVVISTYIDKYDRT